MARIAAGAKHSKQQLAGDRLAAGQKEQHQQQKERNAKATTQQPHRQPEGKRATEAAEQPAQQKQESKLQQAHGSAGALAGPQTQAKSQEGMLIKAAAGAPAGKQAPPAEARAKHAEPRQSAGAATAAEPLVAQAGGCQAMLQGQGAADKEPAANAQQQQPPPPSKASKGSLLQNQLHGLTSAQSQQLCSQAGPTAQSHAQDQAQKPCGLPAQPATAQHQPRLSQAGPAEQLQLQAPVVVFSQPQHQHSALQLLRQAAESPAGWPVAQQPQGADPGGCWAPLQHQGLQPGTQWAHQLGLTSGQVQQPQLPLHQQQQLLLLAQLQAQLAPGPSGGSSMSSVPVQGTQTALAAALAAIRSRERQTLPAVVLAAACQPLADPTADALRAQASPLASGPRLAEQGLPQVPRSDLQPPLSGAAAAGPAAPAALGNDNFDWAAWMQPEDLAGGIAGRTKRQASRRQLQSQHQQADFAADPDFTLPVEEFNSGRQHRQPAARVQPSEQPTSKQKRARSSGQQPLRQGKRRKAPPWEEATEDSAAAAGPGSAAEGQSLPAAARSRRSAPRGQNAQRPRRSTKPSKGWGQRQQQGSRSSHDGSPAVGTSSSDPEISEAEGPHLPNQALGKSRLSNRSTGVDVSQQPAARLTRRALHGAVSNK